MEVKRTVLESLEKVAEELNYVDYTVAIERASGNANVMSALFAVTLSAPEKPDMKLIVKVAILTDKIRKVAAIIPYDAELYFYSKLQKLFEKLEEKYDLPENQRIRTPNLYCLRDDYLKETLVLEDLAAQGFQNFDRAQPADMEYMYAGIDLMAKFHALSMTYNRDDPEGFRQTSESLAMNEKKFKDYFLSVQTKALETALAAADVQHKRRLQKYLETTENYLQIMFNYRYHGRNILVHGDFKPRNLMHRRRNGKLELAILDFQMVHDGDPVVDLIYFIFTATDEQFRRDHYHELQDLYYERLREALHNLHMEPESVYPEKVYRAQLEECTMLGLAIAVAVLPLILVDDNKAPELDHEDSDVSDLSAEGSALFKERFNGVMNNFVEWGLL